MEPGKYPGDSAAACCRVILIEKSPGPFLQRSRGFKFVQMFTTRTDCS